MKLYYIKVKFGKAEEYLLEISAYFKKAKELHPDARGDKEGIVFSEPFLI